MTRGHYSDIGFHVQSNDIVVGRSKPQTIPTFSWIFYGRVPAVQNLAVHLSLWKRDSRVHDSCLDLLNRGLMLMNMPLNQDLKWDRSFYGVIVTFSDWFPTKPIAGSLCYFILSIKSWLLLIEGIGLKFFLSTLCLMYRVVIHNL
jgi:hypothetical protein